MAIYHMQAKVVSRGSGRSAVAASAYMSCSRMYNDYDGIQHDYTRKHGLIYQEVMLPPMAPQEWKDREQLWNAVEAAEKTKDSRLAREFVVALPVELDKDSNISLLQNFIQKNFVDMGMCADFAKLATTSSTGGLLLALQRAIVTARPKGRYRKHFCWPAIKRYYSNLLVSILLLALLYTFELLHLLYCQSFQHNIL